MDWVALLSTPGAIALFTGTASVVTLWLANHHADRLADKRVVERREELSLESRERRYEDRRDAVVELDRVAERETDRISDSEEDPQTGYSSPGAIYPEYRFPELSAAHARVVMLATPEVVSAADELREAVIAAFHGEKGHWDRYRECLTKFRTASRAMLTRDEQSGRTAAVEKAIPPRRGVLKAGKS